MDTTDSSHTAPDRAAIAAMVAAYRSRVLSPDQATRWLPRLKELVVASVPCSTKKANLYLSAGCRFLVDMAETGDGTVDGLLCDETVARWSHKFGSQGRTTSTLGNYLGALNRLVDTRKGLPVQHRQPSAGNTSAASPGFALVEDLFEHALADGTDVAAAWVVAVGAGRPAQSGIGGVVATGAVAFADGPLAVHLVDAVVPLARRIEGAKVGEGSWAALRRVAADNGWQEPAGTALAVHRVLALSEHRSFVDTVRRHRLAYGSIDSARPHLAAVDADTAACLLRGPS